MARAEDRGWGLVWRGTVLSFLGVLGGMMIFVSGCGHKTLVRPPSLVAPEPIGDLALKIKDHGVTLNWTRPQRYMDGSEMDDLGGFVVLRATRYGDVAQAFSRIALIPVEDRDRFRQAKKFNYTDEPLSAGILYRYRVRAVTLDGYLGNLSNTVELVWQDGG
jgi:hypothetical protein